MTRMVSAKPPSLRLGSLDTLICPLMPRSATGVFHWFDAPRPLRRASAAPSAIRKGHSYPVGRIATAGRRPCSGSEPEAQRTPRRPCPAVAIVIFGRISSVAALRQVLLRDQEPRHGSARRWNAQSANRRDCDPVKRGPFSHGKAAGNGKPGRRRIRERDRARTRQQEAPPKRGPSQGGNAPRGANKDYLSRAIGAKFSLPVPVAGLWTEGTSQRSGRAASLRCSVAYDSRSATSLPRARERRK